MAATTSVHVVSIVELILQHANWFFPEDVDFNVSGMFAMPGCPGTPDSEVGSIDRRRPGSQGSLDSDSSRKDSPANKQLDHSVRRAGTVNKKQHSVPNFQPPLPPIDPGGAPVFDPAPLSPPSGALEAGQLTQTENSNVIRETASTPPTLKNGPGGVSGTPNQLNLGIPASSTKGPSPFMVRRGTKKQAPAPPKLAPPTAPQGTIKVSPNQTTPVSAPHPSTVPRRNTQTIIHAPSHPPPQPPLQSVEEPESSPPRTPTPPDTPTHDTFQAPGSSFSTGSLSRPRPTPRPRPKPTVPPPPQPTSEAANGVCLSASKIISDGDESITGPGLDLVPELAEDEQVETLPEPQHQSESTAL